MGPILGNRLEKADPIIIMSALGSFTLCPHKIKNDVKGLFSNKIPKAAQLLNHPSTICQHRNKLQNLLLGVFFGLRATRSFAARLEAPAI
jgi:hypothetical protein